MCHGPVPAPGPAVKDPWFRPKREINNCKLEVLVKYGA